MTTINDIAKIVGVSKATVSNVFTKKKKVGKEIEQRILDVCKELNYYPNRMAASLVTKKMDILGLFLMSGDEFYKKYYNDLINGVTTAASRHKYRVLLDVCTEDDEQVYNSLISRSDPIDGAIICRPTMQDARIYGMMERNIPFVLIGRPSDEIDGKVLYVDVDNIDLVYKTTIHLLELGHKNIGFLNSAPNAVITFDRMKGYLKALKEYNIDFDPFLVYNTDNTALTGKILCNELIKNKSNITAIITCSDDVAVGVYGVLEEHGYQIPKDVSVLALGGDDFLDRLSPKLATVTVDYRNIGEKAVELLMRKTNNEQMDENKIIVDVQILEGESVGPCKDI